MVLLNENTQFRFICEREETSTYIKSDVKIELIVNITDEGVRCSY